MGRWGLLRACLAVLVAVTVTVGGGVLARGDAAHARVVARLAKVGGLAVGDGRTSGDHARLAVSWRSVRGATSYQVFYDGSRDMRGARKVSSGDTSRTVGRLRPSHTYCFRVRAVRAVPRKRTKYGAFSAVQCERTPRAVADARPAWVTAQRVESTPQGPRTSLTLRWPAVLGATAYDVHYASSYHVSSSPSRAVVRDVRRSGGAIEARVVSGLRPGAKYCFEVRGRSSTGIGRPGPAHCKIAMPAARALEPTSFALKMATFNVCGKSELCQRRWSWATRRPLVAQHVLMSGADVVTLQETRNALSDIVADLEPQGFVKACSWANAQAVLVRRSAYSVLWGSAGGVRFDNDPAHGGCWAKLRHRATGTTVVVASVHLRKGRGAWPSKVRGAQIAKVASLMQAKYGAVGARSTPPFVIGGDFNSHRAHPDDAARIRLAKLGFAEAYDVSATYATPYRNSANQYRAKPLTSHVWGSHVDRIFVPAGATVTGWRTVARVRGGRYVTPLPSDHNPVAVTVYLPSAGGLLGGLLG